MQLVPSAAGFPASPTPLVLSDRLISLARDADRAGLLGTARDLIRLAHTVFDEPADDHRTSAEPYPR